MTSREFRYHKRKKIKSETWEDIWAKRISDEIDRLAVESLVEFAKDNPNIEALSQKEIIEKYKNTIVDPKYYGRIDEINA